MNKIHIKEPPFQGVEWFTHFSKLTGPPSFMHRIDVVKELGGFPESLLIGQDAAFHINLALNYKIAFLDSYAYCYTRHSNSTTVKNNNVESLATKHFKQYVNFYIPEIIVNNEMLHLKTLLYKKVFNAMSHIIMEELSIAKRWSKCKRLKKEIKPMEVPLIINVLLYAICISNLRFIHKTILSRTLNFIRK